MQTRELRDDFHTSIAACKVAIRYVMGFGFLSNILMLAVPLYSLQVLDRVLSSSSNDTLMMLTLIVVAALVALTMLQSARSRVTQKTAEWLERKLAPDLFTASVLQSAQVRTLNASQGLRDLASVRQFVGGPVFGAIIDAPWSMIFLIMLFMLHTTVGVIALLGAVVLVMLALCEESAVRPSTEESSRAAFKSFAQLEMAARNAEVVEAMGMIPHLLKQWHIQHDRSLSLSAISQARASKLGSVSRFIRLAVQVLIIGVSAWLVLHNEMTAGAIIAASILVGRVLAPVETVISGWTQVAAVRESYQRLKNSFERAPLLREEEIELPAPIGRLEAEQLAFVPPGMKKPTLRGVTFKLEPGETLGVVGPSGAGKSTLVKLITGVWKPAAGSIRLDGAEIHRWRREQFGRHVGYLPQDVELFAGTVRQNIARMDDGAHDGDVVAAAKLAGVHELILQLPQGYETEIGVGGAVLSGGQRQRIALARAVYGNPSMLVLDEPNASLDGEGENALMHVIRWAKHQRITVVMVSHRPTLMQLADKMMMLKNGEMLSFGEREDQLSKLRGPAPALVRKNAKPEKAGE